MEGLMRLDLIDLIDLVNHVGDRGYEQHVQAFQEVMLSGNVPQPSYMFLVDFFYWYGRLRQFYSHASERYVETTTATILYRNGWRAVSYYGVQFSIRKYPSTYNPKYTAAAA